MLQVYIDNYIVLAIPRSWSQLHNVTNAAMTGIHDVLPLDKDEDEDAISLKKIQKRRAHGQLLITCWDFHLMITQGSIPYGSLKTTIPIF